MKNEYAKMGREELEEQYSKKYSELLPSWQGLFSDSPERWSLEELTFQNEMIDICLIKQDLFLQYARAIKDMSKVLEW